MEVKPIKNLHVQSWWNSIKNKHYLDALDPQAIIQASVFSVVLTAFLQSALQGRTPLAFPYGSDGQKSEKQPEGGERGDYLWTSIFKVDNLWLKLIFFELLINYHIKKDGAVFGRFKVNLI